MYREQLLMKKAEEINGEIQKWADEVGILSHDERISVQFNIRSRYELPFSQAQKILEMSPRSFFTSREILKCGQKASHNHKILTGIISALEAKGIKTMAQFSELTECDLIKYRFCGPKLLKMIKDTMLVNGLSLGSIFP